MSNQEAITPFEQGVCVALTLVGKALASIPAIDINDLRRDAQAVIAAMPSEPRWAGGTRGVHQAALDALVAGFDKVSR